MDAAGESCQHGPAVCYQDESAAGSRANAHGMMGIQLTIFVTSFLAATIVPFYSEFAVGGAIAAGADPMLTLLCASAGNTLGAVVNWLIGRYLLHFQDRRWFPVKQAHLARAQGWFQRYGQWSLLLAWLPVGGDPLTFVAGIMRVRLVPFVLLVGAGKTARYAVLIYIVERAAG
jgi:membrane protein YqaA with SNARE-associated domain